MTPEQREALAEYLTKHAAHYSVCLTVGGLMGTYARNYFDLRDKFGVSGWTTKEEVLERWKANGN